MHQYVSITRFSFCAGDNPIIDTRNYYLVEIGALPALFADIINQFKTEVG